MADQDIERLRADAAAQRQAIATDLELMGDRVSPTRIAERQKAQLRERVHGVRNTVFGASDRFRPSSGYVSAPAPTYTPSSTGSQDEGQSLTDRASTALDAAKQATPDSLGQVTEGNPLAAGIVGFGVGLLAATLLPSSPDERRAANRIQGSLDEAAAQLGRTGKEAVEHIKPEAQQAVADLKDSAMESAEAVKSEAQSGAESVKGTAQEKVEDAKP